MKILEELEKIDETTEKLKQEIDMNKEKIKEATKERQKQAIQKKIKKYEEIAKKVIEEKKSKLREIIESEDEKIDEPYMYNIMEKTAENVYMGPGDYRDPRAYIRFEGSVATDSFLTTEREQMFEKEAGYKSMDMSWNWIERKIDLNEKDIVELEMKKKKIDLVKKSTDESLDERGKFYFKNPALELESELRDEIKWVGPRDPQMLPKEEVHILSTLYDLGIEQCQILTKEQVDMEMTLREALLVLGDANTRYYFKTNTQIKEEKIENEKRQGKESKKMNLEKNTLPVKKSKISFESIKNAINKILERGER